MKQGGNMNNMKLLKYIDEAMIETYGHMEQRVRDNEINATVDEILSIMDDLPFCDPEDAQNHNYELGRYRAFNEIKKLLEDNNLTAESVLEIMKRGTTINFSSGYRFESDLEDDYIRLYHPHGSDGMVRMDLKGAELALKTEKSYREIISNG